MRNVILHGHIFKNAGTTFDYALKSFFKSSFYDHRDDSALRKGKGKYLLEFLASKPHIKAFSSHHLCSPLPICNDINFVPVYFLRHPIERIVSVYEFERKQPPITPGSKMAKKLDILDYVRWRNNPSVGRTIRNFQTAYLCGQERLDKHKEVTNIQFEIACEHLFSDSTLYGIVDLFGESVVYIENKLTKIYPGIQLPYKSKNVQNNSSFDTKLTEAVKRLDPVLDQILANNEYDMKLYTVAREHFKNILTN